MGFEKSIESLEKHGETEVAQFKNQELYLVSTEEVKQLL